MTRLHRLLTEHNVFSRIERLQGIDLESNRQEAIDLVESIDRDVTRSMLASEKSIRRPSPTPFSSQLSQACIKVSLLKCQLSSILFKKDKSKSITLLQSRLTESMTLQTDLTLIKSTLRYLRTEVRLVEDHMSDERSDLR